MDQCIFCQIVQGKIPSHQVYADESVVAFLDIHPVRPGHVLLIPKEHIPTMTDADPQILAVLYAKAADLMRLMKEKLKADYVMLYVVGIDVPHFHIHLLPRKHGDGLQGWPTSSYKQSEAEQIVESLKATAIE